MAEEQAGDRHPVRIGSREHVERTLADIEEFAWRCLNRTLYGPNAGADRLAMMRALEEREAEWQTWLNR
jgi:hypothetical protein